jgi:hypothetical protein
MKILPLVCLGLLSFRSLAHADLTIIQSVEGNTGTYEVTLKIKAERARIEVDPKSSMIVDSKSGEVITLVHDQKAVVRLSGEKAKALGNMTKASRKDIDSSLEVVTPKPTDKKEKINGYEADEYTAETPQYQATYWVAKTYPDWQTIERQMKVLQNKALTAIRWPRPDYYDFPGLPIRTRMKVKGQEEVTTTISSVSQAPIPDSEFTVPAGYAEVILPELQPRATPPSVPFAPEEQQPGGQ